MRRPVSATLSRFGCALAVAVISVASLVVVTPAQAEGPALRGDMIAALESMQSRLADGDLATVAQSAATSAERLQGGNAADRWARALFLQLAANANARRGEPGAAADQLAQARRIDQAPASRRLAWLAQEARLRLKAEQTERGADLLTTWVEQSGGDDDSRWLLIQARASLGQWQAAANSLDRLREQGSQGWSGEQLQLASRVYQAVGRFDEALSLLGDDGDSPAVWRRAAALAQQAGNDGRAAAIWDAGWRRGQLTSAEDLLQLAKLHIAGGTPARAGEYLARWLEEGKLASTDANRRLLAQAWTAARDHAKALSAWQALATQSQRDEDWRQLAEVAYGWGEWQTAIEALSQLDTLSGREQLLKGGASLQIDRPAAAREAFRQAQAAGESQATQWLESLGNG
ncbi:tetratricopeptide repeat protein [Salinicola avicenniae]|uniref:tetratricopeptide repeat protein n=1 Tax=Salinicola avicenniae TaxID=2916836 RepID=UPI0020733FED|nr:MULTISPECIES: hypothetical protein [unclassified Salinicola]